MTNKNTTKNGANLETGKTYSLLLIDDRNGDSDMICEHKSASEVKQLISDAKYRTFTVVAFPRTCTADSSGSEKIILKHGELNRSEKLAKLRRMISSK